MPVLLGLLVAASFGSGDFLGGLASRRARTLLVLGIVQAAALVGAVAAALLAGGDPTPHDLLLGALGGLLNVVALGCLYRGLAIGRIGTVAPVTAVIASVIPVGWGLAIGERPSALALVGVGIAVVAGGLIAREPDDPDNPSSSSSQALLLAVFGGIGFGTSLICYAATDHASGMWPVLTARGTAVVAVGVIVLSTRVPPTLPRPAAGQAVVAGVLDVIATVLLLVAVRDGLTSTVAPVAALAPGFTVGHAWWYLHERAAPAQLAGLVLALAGLALIAYSSTT